MQKPDWSFVAMEYYAVILNRTFLVTINDESLIGVKCRGITSIASGGDPFTRAITTNLAVSGDLNDPSAYIDERLLKNSSSANFTIMLSDIRSVEYNPRKKWGMGYYPHDGRVFIVTEKCRREFIILGRQSGRGICNHLSAAVERANPSFKRGALKRAP